METKTLKGEDAMDNKSIDVVAMSAKPFLVLLGFAWMGMTSTALAIGYVGSKIIGNWRKQAAENEEKSGD